MNILIPDSWLRDFIKTKATPKEIAKALSLCSLSVEKIEKRGKDSIYEVEIPPNRYDCLSVWGVAREAVASLRSFGINARLRKGSTLPRVEPSRGLNLGKLDLKVKLDPTLCPHFAAIVLDNVHVEPSPKTIQDRLEAAGIRSLNNVVDTTNYIMLGLGQPMHAFDFDRLAPVHPTGVAARKMILRESRVGERLTTLDGVNRKLPKGSIVIEDGEKLIDLCGIMGGENTEIGKDTKRVILFAQIYEPGRIRKTSMTIPLRTEAAQRFEKGLDPKMVLPALAQAVKILKENAGARVASKLVDIESASFKPKKVILTHQKLTQYLGVESKPAEVVKILNSLGIKTEYHTLEYHSQIPSWRDKDITIEEDLIEEVARIYGYHNLPSTLPTGSPPREIIDKKFATERRLKVLLKDLGFTEVYTYSMVKEPQMKGALKLRNPLTEDLVYMRIELIPSLLKVIEENKPRFEEIKIFEMANGYFPEKEGKLPQEKMLLACLMTLGGGNEESFRKIKGLLEAVLDELNIKDYTFKEAATFPYGMGIYPFDPKLSAIVWPTKKIKSGKIITPVGKVKDNIWGFQIHVEALIELSTDVKTYTPIPEYPPVIEDLSAIFDYHTLEYDIQKTVKRAGGKLLAKVEPYDIYQNKRMKKEGRKSITLRLFYQHPKKSLSDKDVTPIRKKIIKALEKEHGARVRTASR